MKTSNRVLMEMARQSLVGKWGLAVGTFAIYSAIVIGLGGIRNSGSIISLLITGPFLVGLSIFSLALSRNQNPKIEQIFEGFKTYGRSLVAYLLVTVFTILWTLLFVIPGIIASISYSQTFFILVDDPNISASEAIKKSKKMMYGYKWKYFCLKLRFIGWFIISLLTLGIGFLWLIPYAYISLAKFYDDIKG